VRALVWDDQNSDPVVKKVLSEFELGRPVILPTDTLYGLACPLSDSEALGKIFDIKSRPEEVTLPVAVGIIDNISHVALCSEDQIAYVRTRIPGPYTFILKAVHGMNRYVVKNGTVAVRVPDHPIFNHLYRNCGPLALTSANLHGKQPISSIVDAERQLLGYDLLMIIDEWAVSGRASTIIDLTTPEPMLLRDRTEYNKSDPR
jgi:tRNA threonylcarbamoyl adenosine modification protein (Sua5/YciO/YrdC/YwlC family)